MVINILIGIVFLLLMGWLLRGALQRPPRPGELIRRKEEARRAAQDKLDAALARAGAFSQIRLDELFAAVQDMRGALSRGRSFDAARRPEAVELALGERTLRITHHLREMDLDRENLNDAYFERLEIFRLEAPGRSPENFSDLESLLDRLAALIVEFSSQPRGLE